MTLQQWAREAREFIDNGFEDRYVARKAKILLASYPPESASSSEIPNGSDLVQCQFCKSQYDDKYIRHNMDPEKSYCPVCGVQLFTAYPESDTVREKLKLYDEAVEMIKERYLILCENIKLLSEDYPEPSKEAKRLKLKYDKFFARAAKLEEEGKG